ncbi:hypothetical protein N866_10385 [Actinotalea ferrariae CF5-4]|uniref:Restriction endonuclease type IV Mrr domain-containing protein n=1 Tax=Actinotalea ferrariae CF5-4 TaxID=948458 RepID=A0A021VQB4_9CELL|nr:hypothetical protein N866_10385 [Actinotalea ferrariae CF5-4]
MLTPRALAWARGAGRALAAWHTHKELRATGIDSAAFRRLSVAASVYVDGTAEEWVRGVEHHDTKYLLADAAFAAFKAQALERLAAAQADQSASRVRRRPGGPDLYPEGQAEARMEQLALARLDVLSDSELRIFDDGVEHYVDVYIPERLREEAWRILAREWPFMSAPKRREPPVARPFSGAEDLAFAARVHWENGLVDAYESEATALAEHGIRVLTRAVADRRAGHRPTSVVSEPPPPQPYGVSPDGAERLAAAWMQHLGATGVAVTRGTKDGGLDVVADRYIAQVKAWAGPVSVVEVRAMAGVAA